MRRAAAIVYLALIGCGGGEAVRPVAVSAMGEHACVAGADGGVRCAGSNQHGELGDGSKQPRRAFASVAGLGGRAKGVAVGMDHACALLEDGTVWCWGGNDRGQVGDGTKEDRLAPERVDGLVSGGTVGGAVVEIAAGAYATCARLRTGEVMCWGGNAEGTLGDGTTEDRLRPVGVSGLAGARLVALGDDHACAAFGAARDLVCWGKNVDGRLGDATTERRLTPARVASMTGVAMLALGASHTCAARDDGDLSCWGSNAVGQLGDGTGIERHTPTPVRIAAVTRLMAGGNATCAVLGDGRFECWGTHRRAGIDELRAVGSADHFSPRAEPGIDGPIGVALLSDQACALRADGSFACFDSGATTGIDF